MTDEELNEIRSHLTDRTQNWDVRIAQWDRIRLLEEVDRLQKQLQDLTGAAPAPGGETDQTHDCIEPTTDNAVTGSLSREGKGSLDAP